jgi:hypothetical protein
MADSSYSPNRASKSAQIHARLSHPIIDSDGHTIENRAILADYVNQSPGPKRQNGSSHPLARAVTVRCFPT